MQGYMDVIIIKKLYLVHEQKFSVPVKNAVKYLQPYSPESLTERVTSSPSRTVKSWSSCRKKGGCSCLPL